MVFDPYRVAGPLLRRMDAETAHRLAIKALKAGLAGRQSTADDPRLAVSLWDRRFTNPVGLAAGFDKNAEAPDALLGLGFGFVEIGGVTPRPQPGNPRPRVFRLPDNGAVINRMGFNNDGLEVVRERLRRRRRHPTGLLAVNLGKNKDTEDAASDYEKGAAAFGELADFLVINVSSPNTPGLRALQGREPLIEIIRRTQAPLKTLSRRPPLLLKIAPDLTEADEADIAEVAVSEQLDGLIVSNTTLARPDSLRGDAKGETGGLSGKPLFGPSTALLGRMYQRTDGKIPLVGVGGIASGADAYAKIRAGASLVQLYTALIYQGPSLVQTLKRDLLACLERDGFSSVSEAVGADFR
ncbi:quinone-dependent dihydroorotate dehydrogenase [Insolitispirillum peregrinum]|uniref:Dihydroorotate dehydrogenase (quinone) n=1 Tax=Insolitispirillum peregrinum TaxID=80876 RepID=A0A1N7IJ92_9PROT|nr:quinone-dependent dihydroorotate dehydrogenase [Insolitispirillum peregrinum]SIS37066.1 dihydroorotate oxidase A [Insolitispirillum peregrinum]